MLRAISMLTVVVLALIPPAVFTEGPFSPQRWFQAALAGPASPAASLPAVAAALGDCPPEGSASAEPRCYFAWGLEAYARRDYERAISFFGRAVDGDPANAPYYNWRGLSHGGSRDYDRALADFTRAIELAAEEPAWHSNRAWAYAMRGYLAEAIADLSRAIELSPDSAYLYGSRADTYIGAGDYERAIADYSRAIELSPRSSSLYFRRGVAYDYRRDYDRAILDKTRASGMDPDRGEYYFSLSLSYRAKGDATEADRNLAVAMAKGYKPSAGVAASPTPHVVREYGERDNQGRVRTVRQWSDGRYTASPWELPVTPSPAPQSPPSAPNYLRVTVIGYDYWRSVYRVRVGWKPASSNHTAFVLTSDNLPTPVEVGPDQSSVDISMAGSQGAWICVSVAAKNAAGLSPWTNACTGL